MNRQVRIITAFFCITKLLLHLIADSHSGFQGDELLHIEAGRHLAAGYMEFPPFIAAVAFVQNLFGSDAVFVHHLFSHIAGVLIMVYLAKITVHTGGGKQAVILVLLGFLIAPAFGRSNQLFQPVVFSQLFWIMGFYYLVGFVKDHRSGDLWRLTGCCILGFLTKYDSVFFLAGLLSLLMFARTRRALVACKCWLPLLLFAVVILPNVIWQIRNDFPALQMFDRLYKTQLSGLQRTTTVAKLLMSINPFTAFLLLIPGVCFLAFFKRGRVFLPLAGAIAISFFLLLYKNGKPYYFFPVILTILPFGALFWEQEVLMKRKWIMYPVTGLLLLGGLMIPFGMPVYNLPTYLKRIFPYEGEMASDGHYRVKFDEYYTRSKWKETLHELKTVYDSLPANERAHCLIWGKHYSQAGIVSLYRNVAGKQQLPPVFSYHGSFYTWAPGGAMPHTIIALSYQAGNFFDPYFDFVVPVRKIENPFAEKEEERFQYIYICKQPKQSLDQMKLLFRYRIFE
ncbi:ArnT family glycosyltransferase [Niabella aurantiaca]|uniref:ArnT family glycosyltransferase n=1 Tax=Niabella aurantiaca TaxID=379900 RepID=UPI0012F9FD53|nr:glycosyltransferase family 39 protein [Niabella aurantiaca]